MLYTRNNSSFPRVRVCVCVCVHECVSPARQASTDARDRSLFSSVSVTHLFLPGSCLCLCSFPTELPDF